MSDYCECFDIPLLCRVSRMIVLLLVSYRSIHLLTVLCCNTNFNQKLPEILLLLSCGFYPVVPRFVGVRIAAFGMALVF